MNERLELEQRLTELQNLKSDIGTSWFPKQSEIDALDEEISQVEDNIQAYDYYDTLNERTDGTEPEMGD